MAEEIPIDLVMRVRDEMSAALDRVSKEIGSVSSSADRMTSEVDGAGKELGDYASAADHASTSSGGFSAKLVALGNIAGQLAMDALRALGNAVGDVVTSMVEGNAEMERYETQFGVLLGSTGAAKDRLKELADFGARTPFELPEVVRADKVLQGFGLHSAEAAKKFGMSGSQIRTLAGDLAAGTGTSFEDMATYLGKFASGSTGEVISRFQELGITTREELAKMGLQFSKSGELTTPAAEAFTVLAKVAKDKFGGMMDAQSKTFEGMISNLNDWKGQTLRTIGEPIFEVLKDKLGAVLDFLGKPETKAMIENFAHGLAAALGNVVTWIETNWPTIEATVVGVFNAISNVWNNVLSPVITFAIDLFTSFYNNVDSSMSAASDTIDEAMSNINAIVRQVLLDVADIFGTNGDDIVNFVTDTWDTISSIVSGVVTLIASVINHYMPVIQETIANAMFIIKATFDVTWAAIKIIVGTALDLISGLINFTVAAINGDTEGALNILRNTFENIWERIKETVGKLASDLHDLVNQYLYESQTSIEDIMTGIHDFIVSTWTTIANDVDFAVGTIKNRTAAYFQELRDDTILKFNAMRDAIKAAFSDVVRYYNMAAPFLGMVPINIPEQRGASQRGGASSTASSTANVTVNVYGGDASTAERGTVLALRRAGFRVR